MTDLVAYFKQRPKTAIGLFALAVVLTTAWKLMDRPPTYASNRASVTMQDSYAYGESAGSMGVPDKMTPSIAPMAPPMDYSGRDTAYLMPMPEPSAGPTAAEVDQKIIKNGYLEIVVDKVADAVTEVGRLATMRGGFVQSSSVSERGDGTYSGETTVRVPVAKFEEAMAEIKKLATVVKDETSTGQDVTEQYTDLQAQLRNAKAQEEVYLEILKQAKTVEDILKVQERLGQIRSVIESYEGRIKYLENTTSYSTISVSLSEEPVVRAPTKEFRLGAIFRDAVQTLINSLQNLVAGLVYTVIVWGGILLPIGVLAWVIWRVWRNRMKR